MHAKYDAALVAAILKDIPFKEAEYMWVLTNATSVPIGVRNQHPGCYGWWNNLEASVASLDDIYKHNDRLYIVVAVMGQLLIFDKISLEDYVNRRSKSSHMSHL